MTVPSPSSTAALGLARAAPLPRAPAGAGAARALRRLLGSMLIAGMLWMLGSAAAAPADPPASARAPAAAALAATPALESGQPIAPAARATPADPAWTAWRARWLRHGGTLILLTLGALALLHLVKGPLGRSGNDGPPAIERFTPFERAAHGTNAIAFVLLAASGVVMAFGQFLLPPLLGRQLSGALADALRVIHNFVGPLFALSLPLVLALFLKDNLVGRWDWRWLASGGPWGAEPAPAHRFNAGQKGIYWCGMFLAGLAAVGSGLALDRLIPGWRATHGQMQAAQLIHLVAALLMLALLAGHVYMGSIGVRGAWRAMRSGRVDAAWAREHHGLWHDDVVAGRIAAQRSGTGPDGMPLARTSSDAGRPPCRPRA